MTKNAKLPMPGKTVALVEWSVGGHHRTYFTLFASALLENGVRVVPFCPWADEMPALIAATELGRDSEAMARLEPAEHCLWPTAVWVRPEGLKNLLCPLKHFGMLHRRMKAWERKHGKAIDLVFFCCIYDRHFRFFSIAQRLFPRRWAGLYLDSRAMRLPGASYPYSDEIPCPEKILTLPRMSAVLTLDEGIRKKMETISNGSPVVWMPDVADTMCPAKGTQEGGLGEKIRAFAAGRKVVGCLGHLQKTKGILNLVRAAADPRMENVCFAFVGDVLWKGYTEAEKKEIISAWESSPNIFCHPQRVSSEMVFNSAIAACDVIAAVYANFTNSSNILTKAAAFGKPVVAHDAFLMSERVRKFNLGLVVPEGNQEQLVDTIAELTSGSHRWQTEGALWSQYLAEHSYARFKEAMENVLYNV